MTARSSNSKLPPLNPVRDLPWLHSPLVTGLIMGCSVWLGFLFSSHSQNLSTIWIANGIMLMWLLPVPRARLPLHILSAAIACVVAGWLFHFPLPLLCITALGNVIEVVALLKLTRRYYDIPARRFRITALRFTLLCIAVAGGLGAAAAPFVFRYTRLEPRATIANWFFGDLLGLLLVTGLVGFWRRRAYLCSFQRPQLDGTLLCISMVFVGSWLIFKQDTYSLLFVVVSMLIYVVFRRGIALAVLCFALHTVIAATYTLHGHGPLALLIHISPRAQIVGLQIYLLILLSTIYPVGVALYAQQKLRSLYSLLADNSGDVITRANLDGIRHYCSPSSIRVLGWTPAEMVNVTAATLYHPEDAPRFQELFQRMRAGETTAGVIPYRARTKAGHYLWMEAHIRVLLDPVTGNPTGFIANSRDISERVAAEAKLQVAHKALLRLASTDPLNGLANRRTFDESLEREWRRAQRERTPLALIMMDVDFFKKYNDALGHPAGDECMRRIALCLSQVVQRPSDMVCRYGGEEFVALLPFTEAAGAQQLGQRIIDALAALALPHPCSPTCGTVTLSIGVASIFPSLGYSPTSVVAAADRALYMAKNNGRNRMETAVAERDPSPHRADWEHLRLEGDEVSPATLAGVASIDSLTGIPIAARLEAEFEAEPLPASSIHLF